MKIDLFSCGGGFLEGGRAIGLAFDVAVDIDPILTSSAHLNFPATRHFLQDIALANEDTVAEWTGGRDVDLVVGGPPCQGFSLIGKRDETDPRRDLLGHFFRMVALLRPKVFLMENVAGLMTSSTRPLLERALATWVKDYTILEPRVLDASHFGAPTRRKRVFVVGFHEGETKSLDWDTLEFSGKPTNVEDAIYDLQGTRELASNGDARRWRLDPNLQPSVYAAALRRDDGIVDGMEPTQHTDAVLERFARVEQGGKDPVGRYPRLEWSGLCPTLRAGTGRDRGSHQAIRPIHPVENRVITVREAARLQGFPDRHIFHRTKWHSFRMIGNSVAPPMASALLSWIDTNSEFDVGGHVLQAAE